MATTTDNMPDNKPDSTSPVLRDVVLAHGRYYGTWHADKYLCPIDAEEANRLDLFHKFFLVARKNALFSVPLTQDRPLRILDLGTGTAIWAINVAEEAVFEPQIMAVDLHRIQPARIPRGMMTVQFDIEDQCWDALMDTCDLAHIRMLYGSIHRENWNYIYSQVFNRLAPGSGYIEHVEIDWIPGWEGTDIPLDSAIKRWSDLFLEGLERFGRLVRINTPEVKRAMENAGFVDFKEETIRCYVNPWSEIKHEREIARWFNLGLSHGLEAMSFKPMIDGLKLNFGEVREICDRAKLETCVLRHHAYFMMHIWTAKRPYH